MEIKRVILASNNNKLYYEFWNHVSKVYSEKFNITPVLIWVGTESEKNNLGISDEYGEVIVTNPNTNYPINSQCTFAPYWGTQFFPDDVCLVCGIDEVPLSGLFLKDLVRKYEDEDYLMLISDAYGNQHWSIDNSVSPSGYHVGKGKIFSDIYNLKEKFDENIDEIMLSGVISTYMSSHIGGYPSVNENWGMDEIFISHKLRNYNGKYNLVSLNNFELMLNNRIECFRDTEPIYDLERLRRGGYAHSHLCRPLSNHTDFILNMFNNIPKSF